MISACRLLLIVLSFLLLAFPCTAAAAPTLRVSLPPSFGSLPFAFARDWGLYESHGVDVELIGLGDSQARNLAMITGTIDAMVCDVTTAILLATSGTDIVITSTAYRPSQTGSLSLLSPSYFKIESIGDLLQRTAAGNQFRSIGIIEMSDIEYQIDTLFASLGYPIDPDRDLWGLFDMLQLATFLSLGSVYAAVLPEPYITYISNYPPIVPNSKFVHLSDFEGIELLPSVIVFRREILDRYDGSVGRLYVAHAEAIDRINAMTREELIDQGIDVALSLFFQGVSRETIPEGILDSFVMPHFDPPGMLSEALFEDVVAWTNAKRYTWKHPVYEEMTTARFLP